MFAEQLEWRLWAFGHGGREDANAIRIPNSRQNSVTLLCLGSLGSRLLPWTANKAI